MTTSNDHAKMLARMSSKPSAKVLKMIRETCAASRRAQNSKVSFVGPLLRDSKPRLFDVTEG